MRKRKVDLLLGVVPAKGPGPRSRLLPWSIHAQFPPFLVPLYAPLAICMYNKGNKNSMRGIKFQVIPGYSPLLPFLSSLISHRPDPHDLCRPRCPPCYHIGTSYSLYNLKNKHLF